MGRVMSVNIVERRINVEIKGINGECRNEAVADALKAFNVKQGRRANYGLREKKVSWPRAKAVVGIRVDVSTGHAVGFLTADMVK